MEIHQPFFSIIPLCIGFILDFILGDPRWLPHPIRLFGWCIYKGEARLNKGNYKLVNGAAMSITYVLAVWFIVYYLLEIVSFNNVIYCVLSLILVFYCIANRALIQEVLLVENMLSTKGIEAARTQLATIVGRDTQQLTANQIRIAALETLSENLSDGVIAPLFYYAIGGLPLMCAYKMVNTLDSMIGYKNQRYKNFGFVAAKIDDIANYIPARITAILMALVAVSPRGFLYIFIYGNKHASPNSGFPEAALAGILDCRFGGPNTYGGLLVHKDYIGANDREIKTRDIAKAAFINIGVVLVCMFVISIFIFQSNQ